MRQDWIEFETNPDTEKCNRISIRPEYIMTVQDRTNGQTAISFEIANDYGNIDIAEPYEQVKQKIMDAEKVDLSDVVVDHFTKEEYESLKYAVENAGFIQEYEKSLLDKLYEILKEDK